MRAISPMHLVIVFLVIFLLFGAKRLPDLARSLGSSVREFQRGIRGPDERSEAGVEATAEAAGAIDTPVAVFATAAETVKVEEAP